MAKRDRCIPAIELGVGFDLETSRVASSNRKLVENVHIRFPPR
jgi:hypothetical protein